MSKRARNRLDKRDTALELARLCGHGEEMPGEEEIGEVDPVSFEGSDSEPKALFTLPNYVAT